MCGQPNHRRPVRTSLHFLPRGPAIALHDRAHEARELNTADNFQTLIYKMQMLFVIEKQKTDDAFNRRSKQPCVHIDKSRSCCKHNYVGLSLDPVVKNMCSLCRRSAYSGLCGYSTTFC